MIKIIQRFEENTYLKEIFKGNARYQLIILLVFSFRPLVCSEQHSDDFGSNDLLDPEHDSEEHPLTRVRVPVSLWYSDADWSGSRTNMKRMANHLPQLQRLNRIEMAPSYGHLDFMYGRSQGLFTDILEALNDPEAEEVTTEQVKAVNKHVEDMTAHPANSTVVLQLQGAKDLVMENVGEWTGDALGQVAQAVDYLIKTVIWDPADCLASFLGGFISRFLDLFYHMRLPGHLVAC